MQNAINGSVQHDRTRIAFHEQTIIYLTQDLRVFGGHYRKRNMDGPALLTLLTLLASNEAILLLYYEPSAVCKLLHTGKS